MLIDSFPNRSSSELMEQSLCANINETFQPSSNLNVAETKMIAAVVIAAHSLLLPLDFLVVFFRPCDHHFCCCPCRSCHATPKVHVILLCTFTPSNYLYKVIRATSMCMISHHITFTYIPVPGDTAVFFQN